MVHPLLAVAILTVTLAVFAVVGLRIRGGPGDIEQYVVARNSQPAAALGLSFLASGMGAWILFAPPEVGAFVGLDGVIGYALGAASPFVAFALLGRRLRRIAPLGHGLAEFVRLRFGRVFHAYVVGISVLYMAFFVTAELTAVGGVTAILSGLDPRISVVAVAVVTLAYTAYGGLRATLRTDRWQAWLVLVLVAAGAAAVGVSLPAASAEGSAGVWGVDVDGVEVAVTLIIAVTAANLFHQGYWQRVWAARDQAALDRGALIGVASTLPVVVVVGLLGALAASRGVALGDPAVPFFALVGGLPAWVGAAVFVLAVALVASSVDTLENGLAALVAAERPRSTTLTSARVVTVMVMIPAVVVAWQGLSILRLFLIADLLCAATAVPALLGLWSRATGRAALTGAVAGLVGAVVPGWITSGSLAEGIWLATLPGGVPTLPPFAGALVASTVVAVAVSLTSEHRTDLAELGARVQALSGGAAS